MFPEIVLVLVLVLVIESLPARPSTTRLGSESEYEHEYEHEYE
jgi:hypothetical protein